MDENWQIRVDWALRRRTPPTQEQEEKGDMALTPEEIESILTDDDWWERRQWVQRRNFTPTPEQVDRGLVDVDWRVRDT